MTIHPASFRQEIIEASRPQPESDSSSEDGDMAVQDDTNVPESAPLIRTSSDRKPSSDCYGSSHGRPRRGSGIHILHNHNKPKRPAKSGGHGHSHGDMGMNAMVLHVLGDALGNVGVIITALVIWLTDWPGRFYADPVVSLFITLIILRSAIPLTVATANILLQATPDSIDPQHVKEDIQALPGVVSCHHVHIWQLSDTKIVASMHIQVAFPISEAGGEKYMELSKNARKCLHAYGIHSATIQPEFCLDLDHDHEDAAMMTLNMDGAGHGAPAALQCGKGEDLCLIECVDDCVGQGCCLSGSEPQQSGPRPGSSHSHGSHDHDHGNHGGAGHGHHHG